MGSSPQLYAVADAPSYIEIKHIGDEDHYVATIYIANSVEAVTIPKKRTDLPPGFEDQEWIAWRMTHLIHVVNQASYLAINDSLGSKRSKYGFYGWLFYSTSSHFGTLRVSEKSKDGTILSYDYRIPWFLAHKQIKEFDEVVSKLRPDPKLRADLQGLLLALKNAKDGPS